MKKSEKLYLAFININFVIFINALIKEKIDSTSDSHNIVRILFAPEDEFFDYPPGIKLLWMHLTLFPKEMVFNYLKVIIMVQFMTVIIIFYYANKFYFGRELSLLYLSILMLINNLYLEKMTLQFATGIYFVTLFYILVLEMLFRKNPRYAIILIILMLLLSPHLMIIIFYALILSIKYAQFTSRDRIIYAFFITLIFILFIVILISSEFALGQICVLSGCTDYFTLKETQIITLGFQEYFSLKNLTLNEGLVLILIFISIYNIYIHLKYKKYKYLFYINTLMYISIYTGVGQFEFSRGRVGWLAATTSILLVVIHLSELRSKIEISKL
jgi:hypothetical protein